MKHALTYLVGSILIACSPDLDANGAERCGEHATCEPGAVCYRGFCVSDADDLDAGVDPLGALDAAQSDDAAQDPKALPSLDSGRADAALFPSAIADASQSDAAEAGKAAPQEAGPPPAQGPRIPEDAASPTPSPTRPPDAGPPAISAPCTLKACCDEAKHAHDEGEKLDGRWTWRKGKCGCGDPDLMSVLGCSGSSRAGPK